MKLFEIVNETMLMQDDMPQNILDATIKHVQDTGIHIGDQDSKKIFKTTFTDNVIYGIENDNKITSFLSFSKDKNSNGYNVLRVFYTIPEYRGKKDLLRLFWFCKDDEGIKFISSGVNSNAGHELIKSLGRSQRFDMSWLNMKTNEKIKYDFNNDPFPSKFRNKAATPWRIIIEAADQPIFESKFMSLGRAFHVFGDD